jgi:hypothetical protein
MYLRAKFALLRQFQQSTLVTFSYRIHHLSFFILLHERQFNRSVLAIFNLSTSDYAENCGRSPFGFTILNHPR